MSDNPPRAWLAYVLTVVLPGLGHGYLGEWRRGVIWLVVYAVAVAFLSARRLLIGVPEEHPVFGTALDLGGVPPEEVLVPLAVIAVCLLDVYLLQLAETE